MRSLILIGTLLCASLQVTNARIAKVARELKLEHSNSYTVAIEPHLFTIAIQINQSYKPTHLVINSTALNFTPCAIPFEEHSIQNRLEATTIGDKIIVWGIRSKHESHERDVGDKIEHTVLIVDPWQCSFKAASTFEEERPPGFFGNDNLARVVTHNDSFDVFYPSLKTCAPCRYSIEGKRIDLQHQIELDSSVPKYIYPLTFIRIQNYAARPEGGFIYAHNFENRQSVIKILDENFRSVKQRYFDHPIEMIAANPTGHTPEVHLCFMSDISREPNANNTICCKSFDADLEPSRITFLQMLPGHAPDALSMNVDARGDLFVPVTQMMSQSSDRKFGYYWLTSSYELIDAAIISRSSVDNYRRWKVRGFFVDNKYCIENVYDGNYGDSDNQFIKCVIIPQVPDSQN